MPPSLDSDFPSPGLGNNTTSPNPDRSTRPGAVSPPSHHPNRPSVSLPSPTHRLSTSLRRGAALRPSSKPASSSSSSSPSFSSFSTLLASAAALLTRILRLYASLPLAQRVAVLLAGALLLALGVVLLVYSHRILSLLGPLAASVRGDGGSASPLAWCLVWLATCATAFPPVIGYSTCVTVAGFVYGFPGGWPLAASATVAGSAAAFLTSRGFLAGYVQRLVGGDRRFVALGQVLKRDGVGVLVMIRLCPLPYSLSNGFLATVGSIRARTFALATACATPKLLVHVFIGSRLALLAESGDEMSGADRAINYVSMVLFGLVGFGVGLFIYRRTMARAEELAREEGLEAGDALLDGDVSGQEEGVLGGYDDDNGPLVHPDDLDAAAIMGDDDISLWDTEGGDGYRDSWDDGPAVEGPSNGVANAHGTANGNLNGVRRLD